MNFTWPVLLSLFGPPAYWDRLLGPRPLFQFRILNQPASINLSTYTSWEAPDPAFWVPRGYVVVNVDLRGFFASPGEGEVLSDQEAEDYYDCIEWAANQPWSNGKIGLSGVSYLAISQYKVAALNPPHLAAICPWEGFSDAYKDFFYPGGIREDGFARIWGMSVASKTNIRKEQEKRPLRDEWYKSLVPALKKITVPALICGSFSDHCLHSQGSFRAFEEISSPHKWLYTHRWGKWAVYYSAEALTFQQKFFDYFLKGEENGMLEIPPIRLEVRDTGQRIHTVKMVQNFPESTTQWTPLYLNGQTGQLVAEPASEVKTSPFDMEKGKVYFEWRIPGDMEINGPMVLKLAIEVRGASDVNLFGGVRKIRAGRQVVFEGSYGFGYDLVTRGWQKATLRQKDLVHSQLSKPCHDFNLAQPLKEGEIINLEFSLLPSATFFKKGDTLRLDIQGHWFFGTNALIYGPAKYAKSAPGQCIIYTGGNYESYLLLPLPPDQGLLKDN